MHRAVSYSRDLGSKSDFVHDELGLLPETVWFQICFHVFLLSTTSGRSWTISQPIFFQAVFRMVLRWGIPHVATVTYMENPVNMDLVWGYPIQRVVFSCCNSSLVCSSTVYVSWQRNYCCHANQTQGQKKSKPRFIEKGTDIPSLRSRARVWHSGHALKTKFNHVI